MGRGDAESVHTFGSKRPILVSCHTEQFESAEKYFRFRVGKYNWPVDKSCQILTDLLRYETYPV